MHTHMPCNGASRSNFLWPELVLSKVLKLVSGKMNHFVMNLEIIQKIERYVVSHPEVYEDPTRWIRGLGWDQTRFEEGRWPTSVSALADVDTAQLSAICSGRSRTISYSRRSTYCPRTRRCTRHLGVTGSAQHVTGSTPNLRR